MMKNFNKTIYQVQKKIKKTTEQLAQMNRDLKQLMIQKENKQNEFIQLLNEHNRLAKMGK